MNEAYEDEKLSRTQVYFWYKRFKDGRKSITDDSRSGRTLTSTTNRNIGQLRDLIVADRKITIDNISEILGISCANSSVTLQWLPAHVGIPGNELADSLVKAGALGLPEARESTTQLDERDLLRTIKTQCPQEWKTNAAHDWYRTGRTSTGYVLPREQQSLISRLKSSHLQTMTFQNNCKEPIQPYNFEFNIPVGDHNGFGQISRQESKDESGRVVGSYTINDPDGRQRIVNYIADDSGYRASIQTNEPGTKSESPADANIVSSAVDPFAAILANGQRDNLA
ncbi:hypothetical protein LAZ67_12002443 [Cordylochernes scorpioides]|uniref:Uncharacterized protein n=1 Tax=Cordylochernes scorpioides TaxID=51811 RepID=A0ABY6L476_9ARAC|nr:hypothetical protein LAZ67_12002443 [Cordylochernes scorpioides]